MKRSKMYHAHVIEVEAKPLIGRRWGYSYTIDGRDPAESAVESATDWLQALDEGMRQAELQVTNLFFCRKRAM